jgi:magnesium chelatase subunit D
MRSLPPEFIRSLSYTALVPQLRSILVYDCPPSMLLATSAALSEMIEIVTRLPVVRVHLGSVEAEDDLWGTLALSHNRARLALQWETGRLAASIDDARLRLVVIPDLPRLSIAAQRACVMLMGADVAVLERHGQTAEWVPNYCWLASCARADVGQVSPHLLDRFALRLSLPRVAQDNRPAELMSWLKNPHLIERPTLTLDPDNREHIQAAAQRLPTLAPKAIQAISARVREYFGKTQSYGARREIALARLAVAHAQLDGADEVTPEDVDAAAHMIGLRLGMSDANSQASPLTPQPLREPSREAVNLQSRDGEAGTHSIGLTPVDESSIPDDGVIARSPDTQLIAEAASLPPTPYPEDAAPVAREAAPLKLPPQHLRPTTAARGSIIGTMRATQVHDLAIVSTLLEAAKFQRVRRRNNCLAQQGLLISPTDLRSYRRAPVPEQMLVLLLDYTSLRGCDWQDALLDHLHWAYTERASICLIQVGAPGTPEPLLAEQIVGRSVLTPAIGAALELAELVGSVSKATPLAHGLDLALRRVRGALERGRSAVYRARLIILTDGRGNVPLEASRTRKLTPPVGRAGVEDALQVAHGIRGLKHVEIIFLNPQPRHLPDLPYAFAKALGVTPIPIRTLKEMEGK